VTTVLSDARVLHQIAGAMDVELGLPDVESARRELRALGRWRGARPPSPSVEAASRHQEAAATGAAASAPGTLVLASWRMLLDEGRMEDGEPYLARTARPAVARLSPSTAAMIGATEGEVITVSTERGTIALPLAVTDMCDGVVWLPGNSAGSNVRRSLVAEPGDLVQVRTEATP
jgi:NADH-quinone oxidoreductase subunit G